MIEVWRILWFCLTVVAASDVTMNQLQTKLEAAENMLGSPDKITKDLIIQGSLDQNWVNMIRPAPSAVNILCRLGLLASSADDFPLQSPTKGEYNFLTHSNSFKASLYQVTHYGWKAFQEAHSSMDEIAQRANQIPSDLRSVIDVLTQGTVEEVKRYLPMFLTQIKGKIAGCKDRALGTQWVFTNMTGIVAELIQGSMSTDAWAMSEQGKLQLAKQHSTNKQAALKEQQTNLEKRMNDTEQQVNEWRTKYKEAYDKIPGGLDRLALEAVSALTNLLNIVTFNVLKKQSNENEEAVIEDAAVSTFDVCAVQTDGSVGERKIQTAIREFSMQEKLALTLCVGIVTDIVTFSTDLKSGLNPKDIDNTKTERTNLFDERIKQMKGEFEKENVKEDVKLPFSKLFEELLKTSAEIRDLMAKGGVKGKYQHYETLFKSYQKTAQCLEMMAKQILDLPAVPAAQPFKTGGDKKQTLAQDAMEQEQLKSQRKLAESEAALQRYEEQYIMQAEKSENMTNKITEVLNELNKIDVNLKTNEQIRNVLKKALVLLTELEAQWKQITLFFITLEIKIRVSMGDELSKFVEIAEKARSMTSASSLDTYSGNLLYTQILHALAETFIVKGITTKYMKVSALYIMPVIRKAAVMFTADENTKEKYQVELTTLLNDGNTYINELHKEETSKFIGAITQRRQELRDVYEPILSNIPPAKRQEITQAVQVGSEAVKGIPTTSNPSPIEAATIKSPGFENEWGTEEDGFHF